MPVYDEYGTQLNSVYDGSGLSLGSAFDAEGNQIFSASIVLPVPSGNLDASSVIPLPDLHGQAHGFTCTGLAFDEGSNTFIVGDIGILQPGDTPIRSQLVRMPMGLNAVIETIPLYSTFQNMHDVQGVAIDTSDNSIWFCSPSENLIRNITPSGESVDALSVTNPSGIAYDSTDDSLWILTYAGQILHMSKTGTVLGSFSFAYNETLDQCFLDPARGYLYITAGANYSGRNNVYLFNTETHEQSVACSVDSYSVEGIWIGPDRMIILNDGYYHSATVPVNQANIYTL